MMLNDECDDDGDGGGDGGDGDGCDATYAGAEYDGGDDKTGIVFNSKHKAESLISHPNTMQVNR